MTTIERLRELKSRVDLTAKEMRETGFGRRFYEEALEDYQEALVNAAPALLDVVEIARSIMDAYPDHDEDDTARDLIQCDLPKALAALDDVGVGG